jgi:hypothetical protein
MSGCCGPQPGHALLGAQRARAQGRGALMEQHRLANGPAATPWQISVWPDQGS